MKLSPLQQNENPQVPSLICGDRVWKAAELIHALRRGSGVAMDAIYDMTTHCVTQGEPPRPACRDTIEEVTTCILAAVYHGALRRPEFLPDFIEIVTRMFLRQQSPADAPDAVLVTSRNRAPAPLAPLRRSGLRRPRAGSRAIRRKL
jgi:hypothetical protein